MNTRQLLLLAFLIIVAGGFVYGWIYAGQTLSGETQLIVASILGFIWLGIVLAVVGVLGWIGLLGSAFTRKR